MLSASQVGLLQEEERGGQVLHAGWTSSVSTAVNRLPATCCDSNSLGKTWLLPCGAVASLELN